MTGVVSSSACGSCFSYSAVWSRALSAAGSATSSTCPTSSRRPALDVLDAKFGGQGSGIIGTIVFRADQGVDDPAVKEAMQRLFDKVATIARRQYASKALTPTEAGRQIASDGADAGEHRVRKRRDARRHPLRSRRARSATRSSRTSHRSTGCRSSSAASSSPSSKSRRPRCSASPSPSSSSSWRSARCWPWACPIGVALFGIGIGTAIITLLSNFMHDPRLRHVPRRS